MLCLGVHVDYLGALEDGDDNRRNEEQGPESCASRRRQRGGDDKMCRTLRSAEFWLRRRNGFWDGPSDGR